MDGRSGVLYRVVPLLWGVSHGSMDVEYQVMAVYTIKFEADSESDVTVDTKDGSGQDVKVSGEGVIVCDVVNTGDGFTVQTDTLYPWHSIYRLVRRESKSRLITPPATFQAN